VSGESAELTVLLLALAVLAIGLACADSVGLGPRHRRRHGRRA
jgi:hypothetical protein